MEKITKEIKIKGIDEEIEKATKLVALLKEANALANEIASNTNEISIISNVES
jgi:hypothetical protein